VEKHADCDALNIASGVSCDTGELAKMVLEAVGSTVKITFDQTKPVSMRTRRVDISKARSQLDYSPRMPLREGIRDTVAWYKSRLR
jgi:GDP-L-fucose synthase